jgi:hypothetical protein
MLYHVPHHIIFLLVIMIHTSEVSPRTLTLLEYPFTFFTNTRHPLQCYHLSFSTKKDCIFQQYKTLTWLPVYQFGTSSLSGTVVRVAIITSILASSYNFHSTLTSTSLFNSIWHMAIWAQIAIPPWSFHSPYPIGTRSWMTTKASTPSQLELVPMTLWQQRFWYLNKEALKL